MLQNVIRYRTFLILFIALLSAGVFFINQTRADYQFACELPNFPSSGGLSNDFQYHIGSEWGRVWGTLNGGTNNVYLGDGWHQLNGSQLLGFNGPGNYPITLECAVEADPNEPQWPITDYKTITKNYTAIAGGSQCADGIDNEDPEDTLIDYPADPGCTSANDDDESDGGTGGGNPPAIDVTIASNLGQGGWTIGPCPSGAGATTNCPLTGTGQSGHYTGLAGAGTIRITPKQVSGKTVFVRGCADDECYGPEEVTSQDLTIPNNRNQTVYVNWVLDYENEGTPPPSAGIALTPGANCVAPGSNTSVAWHNTSGVSSSTDWLALVPKGTNWNGNWPWKWWNGGTNAGVYPTTAAPFDGSVSFTVPAGTSPLQFLYYRANGTVVAARSGDVIVSDNCQGPPPTVTASLSCKDPSDPNAVWSSACSVPKDRVVQLQWSSNGATGCNVWGFGDWNGTRAASGTEYQGPITATTTFSAQCGDNVQARGLISTAYAASSSVASVIVTPRDDGEEEPPGGTPSIDIKCRASGAQGNIWSDGPCTISKGGSIDLKWTSNNVIACEAFGSWSGSKATSSALTTEGPINTFPQEYNIRCSTPLGRDVLDGLFVNQVNESAPGTPQISGLPACAAGSYNATISWKGNPDPVDGFTVDITDDPNFLSYFSKQTKENSTDFLGFMNAKGVSFTAMPKVTYYVRVFNGVHSPVASFVVSQCAEGSHSECSRERACVQVAGSGDNECSTDRNCAQPPYRSKCDAASERCVLVQEGGSDSCYSSCACGGSDDTCATRHKGCDPVEKKCTWVDGEGIDSCTIIGGQCGDDICVGPDCDTDGAGSCTFTANPDRLVIPPPKSSTLSWSCVRADNCHLSPIVGGINGGAVDPSGTASVSPQVSTKYTLTCDNTKTTGSFSESATVRVFKFEGGSLKEVLP